MSSFIDSVVERESVGAIKMKRGDSSGKGEDDNRKKQRKSCPILKDHVRTGEITGVHFEWPLERRLLYSKYRHEEYFATSMEEVLRQEKETSKTKTENYLRIAGFDLDSTLISTKSGLPFARDETDWKWLAAAVPKIIQEYHLKG